MDVVFACGLSLAFVAYNNTLNRWGRFEGHIYVALNLALATSATAVAVVVYDLSASELGFQGDSGDVWLGMLAALGLTAPMFLIAGSRHAHRIADRRVADLHGRALAYQMLVRVPLGTAVAEEVLFRAVLFASWSATVSSTSLAALVAAIVFGLWHISPTVNLVRSNTARPAAKTVLLSVMGAIAFTTAAGLALTLVRLETGSLVAPLVLHAGTNSLGTLAAVVAARRTGHAAR